MAMTHLPARAAITFARPCIDRDVDAVVLGHQLVEQPLVNPALEEPELPAGASARRSEPAVLYSPADGVGRAARQVSCLMNRQ